MMADPTQWEVLAAFLAQQPERTVTETHRKTVYRPLTNLRVALPTEYAGVVIFLHLQAETPPAEDKPLQFEMLHLDPTDQTVVLAELKVEAPEQSGAPDFVVTVGIQSIHLEQPGRHRFLIGVDGQLLAELPLLVDTPSN